MKIWNFFTQEILLETFICRILPYFWISWKLIVLNNEWAWKTPFPLVFVWMIAGNDLIFPSGSWLFLCDNILHEKKDFEVLNNIAYTQHDINILCEKVEEVWQKGRKKWSMSHVNIAYIWSQEQVFLKS